MSNSPCHSGKPPENNTPGCHSGPEPCHPSTGKPDYLLWGSLFTVVSMYLLYVLFTPQVQAISWLETLTSSVFELINTMWWGIAAGIIMIAILGNIPREFVMSVLGTSSGLNGILRATAAGVLLDLCSHGILMVGAKLYERGASIGQVMAFLVASPWNSFSLTLILIALIGIGWTLVFIVLSMVVAIIVGLLFDWLVGKRVLPANSQQVDLPENFKFWHEAGKGLKSTEYSAGFFASMLIDGITGSRMVLRWILFGVVLASLVRTFMPADMFGTYFGPTVAGLALTVLAATVIEVCSEGSTPIAADLVTRANAPGNGFAFLMTGVSTDYTEIMVMKDTTRSWKIALFLPLLTVPQVLVLAWLLNSFGGQVGL